VDPAELDEPVRPASAEATAAPGTDSNPPATLKKSGQNKPGTPAVGPHRHKAPPAAKPLNDDKNDSNTDSDASGTDSDFSDDLLTDSDDDYYGGEGEK
jgi:hypothetical protein